MDSNKMNTTCLPAPTFGDNPVGSRSTSRFLLPLCVSVSLWFFPSAAWSAGDAIQFNRNIRPILAENCLQCHGPDSASRKAGLRLDQRDAAIEMKALVPGKPEESELVARILSDDAEETMPPPATRKTLTAEQKTLLKNWIAAGAKYQPHWSFIAPQRPALPVVKNQGWGRNPIDRFVLAELEEHGLTPAAEADRRTLARRLSLDLVGLPPDPADVESFVQDNSPGAYERLVDKFLAMPAWGENRGRYWLDAARYGDTHGIHIDNYREMWAYRDWVIGAFNRNQPFDQFTIEQLAGDILPNRTLDQQVASGFHRCNITTSEGGAIADEYLVLYARDRTETTAQVWLGLTAGCAVCHNHKFDPITQREFYQFSAFFNNTTQAGMDGNVKDTPPTIVVPQPEDRAQWEALAKESTNIKQQADARRKAARPEFDGWLAQANPGKVAPLTSLEGLRFHALLGEAGRDRVTVSVDGQVREVPAGKTLAGEPGQVSVEAVKTTPGANIAVAEAGDFDTKQPFSCAAWIKLAKADQTGTIMARLGKGNRGWELGVARGRLNVQLLHETKDDALRTSAIDPVKVGKWAHVVMTYDGSGKAGGVKLFVDGVLQVLRMQTNTLKNTIRTDGPLTIGQRPAGNVLDGVGLQDVRIYSRALPVTEIQRVGQASRAIWLVSKPAKERSAGEKNELYEWWLPALDQPFQQVTSKLAEVGKKQDQIKARSVITHVMQERPEQAMAYILFRGEYDQRREEVKPETPAFLPAFPSDLPHNRLGLAQWLLRPEQPLTARVTVNRFWQEVFGAGLVRSTGDFGGMGETPSHPELLDWLAVDFRESGWDVKRFFKMLVTSATYRQAAVITPVKLEKDASNRLLSRGPRFRMDAEVIRDYALASSGLLVRKIGGPSVKPYQPEGVWEAVAMTGSNTHDYKQDSGENLYRRSMYTFWKRAAPPASMDIFNAPTREVCIVRRERTNTPLQALVTLNDPQFIEAARILATRALKEGGSQPVDRIDYIARRLLSRPMTAAELKVVQASLDQLLGFYKGHADDAKQLLAVGEAKPDATVEAVQLAAWTMLTNELMNLDEVLNK